MNNLLEHLLETLLAYLVLPQGGLCEGVEKGKLLKVVAKKWSV